MTKEQRENCIIHCRVSTPKQAKQGDSLEAQEYIGRAVAQRRSWTVLRVFHEPYSGRKDNRPVINEIATFIKTSPEPVHYYIFKGIDRLTRAGVVDYEKLKGRLEALGVTVVDSYGLIQPKQNTLEHLGFEYDWSVYAPSETAEILEAHRGKQEVRDILTRIIGAEIKLTQEGYKVRQAADGYLNKRVDIDGKKRVIEVPDPQRAHFFQELFRLRAKTGLSDQEIANRITAMGFRTKPMRRWDRQRNRIIGYTKRRPMTAKYVQELIKRPIYCGVRVEKWTGGEPIRTKYPGLVSIKLWNEANRDKVRIEEHPNGSLSIHHGQRPKPVRLRANPLYPYKNVILCPECEKPFRGSASRGRLGTRYPAYHCDRDHYLRIPKADFEESIDGYLATLTPEGVSPDELKEALLRVWEERRDDVENEHRRIQENLAALRAAQEAALDALLSAESEVVRKKLEARVAELEEQIAEAQAAQPDSVDAVSRDQVEEFADWAAEIMEHPAELLKNPYSIELQRAYFGLVFDKLPTYDDIRNGTPILSPLFGLIWFLNVGESESVHTPHFGWNHLRKLLALRHKINELHLNQPPLMLPPYRKAA